jgi:hypothetical protein
VRRARINLAAATVSSTSWNPATEGDTMALMLIVWAKLWEPVMSDIKRADLRMPTSPASFNK